MAEWKTQPPTLPAGSSWGTAVSGSKYSNQNNLCFKITVSSARGVGSTYYIKFQAIFYTAPSSSVYNKPSTCTIKCGNDTHSITAPSSTTSSGKSVTTYYTGSGGTISADLSVQCTGTCSNPYALSKVTVSVPAIITYTITYDANGGTGTMINQIKISGTNLSLSQNSFIRNGWTFIGWNTKADGTGLSYDERDSYTTDAAVTLYAQWIKASMPLYTKENNEIYETESIYIKQNSNLYKIDTIYIKQNGELKQIT